MVVAISWFGPVLLYLPQFAIINNTFLNIPNNSEGKVGARLRTLTQKKVGQASISCSDGRL